MTTKERLLLNAAISCFMNDDESWFPDGMEIIASLRDNKTDTLEKRLSRDGVALINKELSKIKSRVKKPVGTSPELMRALDTLLAD